MLACRHGHPGGDADCFDGGTGGAGGQGSGSEDRAATGRAGADRVAGGRPGDRGGRSPARSAARIARRASGGCGLPRAAWRGCADAPRSGRRYGAAPDGAFWRSSTPRRPRASRAGRRRCWRGARRRQGPAHLALPAGAEDRPRRAQVVVPSNDPEFVAKAADIVGLYLEPPENAIVLAVDDCSSGLGPPSRTASRRWSGRRDT